MKIDVDPKISSQDTSAISASTKETEQATLINIPSSQVETQTSQMHFIRKMGNLSTFYFISGDPIFVIGPHWPFFACLLTVTISAVGFLFALIWSRSNVIILMFGVIIAGVQVSAYVYTCIINPGLPKKEYEETIYMDETKNFRKCKDCKMWINTEERTFHCYDCGVCIEGFDHHCPWTSKCIGKGNLKPFYIFIGTTIALLGYIVFCLSVMNSE